MSTETNKPSLIGETVGVPRLNGRGKWWMRVIDERGAFVKVESATKARAAGKARWVALGTVTIRTRKAKRIVFEGIDVDRKIPGGKMRLTVGTITFETTG